MIDLGAVRVAIEAANNLGYWSDAAEGNSSIPTGLTQERFGPPRGYYSARNPRVLCSGYVVVEDIDDLMLRAAVLSKADKVKRPKIKTSGDCLILALGPDGDVRWLRPAWWHDHPLPLQNADLLRCAEVLGELRDEVIKLYRELGLAVPGDHYSREQ